MELHVVVIHLFSLPYGYLTVYLCILQLTDFLGISRFSYYKWCRYEHFVRLLWYRNKFLRVKQLGVELLLYREYTLSTFLHNGALFSGGLYQFTLPPAVSVFSLRSGIKQRYPMTTFVQPCIVPQTVITRNMIKL